MAKPILIIQTKAEEGVNYSEATKHVAGLLNHEYHVMFHISEHFEKTDYKCVNDNKGLQDFDIERLINTLNK